MELREAKTREAKNKQHEIDQSSCERIEVSLGGIEFYIFGSVTGNCTICCLQCGGTMARMRLQDDEAKGFSGAPHNEDVEDHKVFEVNILWTTSMICTLRNDL